MNYVCVLVALTAVSISLFLFGLYLCWRAALATYCGQLERALWRGSLTPEFSATCEPSTSHVL